MGEEMSKQLAVETIRSERAALETLLEPLSDHEMTQPGFESDWSVKDILAHIAAWERRMVGWIEESLRGETPSRPAPGTAWDDLDRLNEQIYLQNRDRPLDQVRAEFEASYRESLAAIQGLTEEDLMDPQRFEWRRGDPLWHMVAANTWWHYKEHRETIRNWLQGKRVG
jgi:hypothetical protein